MSECRKKWRCLGWYWSSPTLHNNTGSPGLKSNVIPSHISIALLRSKSCSAELPLRVELICTVWMHKYLTSLRSAMSSALNVVIQSKYTNGIMFNFYPGLPHTVQIYTEKHDHKFARYWSFAPVEYNNWFVACLKWAHSEQWSNLRGLLSLYCKSVALSQVQIWPVYKLACDVRLIVSSPDLSQHVHYFQYNVRDTESDPRWGWFWVWDQDYVRLC